MEEVKEISLGDISNKAPEKSKKAGLKISIKVFKIVGSVLVLLALLISTATLFVLNKKGGTGIFGYKFFAVLSDSMRGDFSVGDMVISKKTDVSSLKEGDIITFISESMECKGSVITHKIKKINNTENGLSFATFGTATGSDDSAPVSAANVIGKYTTRVPKLGYVFNFVKTPFGYVLFAFLPLMSMIVIEIVKIILMLKEHKKDQLEEYKNRILQLQEENLKSKKIIENYNKNAENIGWHKTYVSGMIKTANGHQLILMPIFDCIVYFAVNNLFR